MEPTTPGEGTVMVSGGEPWRYQGSEETEEQYPGEAMTKHMTSLQHRVKLSWAQTGECFFLAPGRSQPFWWGAGTWQQPSEQLDTAIPDPFLLQWNSFWPHGLCQPPALLPPQKCVSEPKEGDRTGLG